MKNGYTICINENKENLHIAIRDFFHFVLLLYRYEGEFCMCPGKE